MVSHLALDVTRTGVRALEIEGSLRSPVVKAFAAADFPPPTEDGEEVDRAKVIAGLLKSMKAPREPAGMAADSTDATFRELELPFSGEEQIGKVIKFEAESHLHLVDIDEVVVSFQKLSSHREGARLLVAAYEKAILVERLDELSSAGIDPTFTDLHLTAMFAALKHAGHIGVAAADDEEEGEAGAEEGGVEETLLFLECDRLTTHLLLTRGDQLLAARAIPLGTAGRSAPDGTILEAEDDDDDDDDSLIVLDDEDLPAVAGALVGRDYFSKLRREVQRTLFPLGAEDDVGRVLVMGPSSDNPAFLSNLQLALGLEAAPIRPVDSFTHKLDDEALDAANREGTAALGVGLRLLGSRISSVDLRQEEVRYARRFDQVKVALACLSIMLLIFVALPTIVRTKVFLVQQRDIITAAYSAVAEYEARSSELELRRQLKEQTLKPSSVVQKVRDNLLDLKDDLRAELGRSGKIPASPSGLNYLNELIKSIDQALPQVGRLELHMIDMDLTKENPLLRLKGLIETQAAADSLRAALVRCPVVESVSTPRVSPRDDRVELSSLEVSLKKEWRPDGQETGS